MKQVDPFGAVRNGNQKLKRAVPVGTVTIRRREWRNGRASEARFIKIRMDGPSPKRWMLFARWWWEKHRGAVPPGQLVFHKDGNEINDVPENLVLGTPGQKIKAAHRRDPAMSKRNHRELGRLRGELNRANGRINRASNFLKGFWYPVVDDMSVILNVPFRQRKRLLGGFGVDVRNYPANGIGKHANSEIQRALEASPVRPVHSYELANRSYTTYCLLEPASRECSGPRSVTVDRLTAHLDRMGLWKYAEKQAKRELKDRK